MARPFKELRKLMYAEGIDRTQLERKQTTIRLPAALKQQLQQEADRLGVPLHDLIAFILWEALRYSLPK